MKLSSKLYGSVGALVGAGLLMAAFSYYNQSDLCARLDTAVKQTTKKLDLVNAMRARVWEAEAQKRGACLSATFGNMVTAETFRQNWGKAMARLREQITEVEPLLVSAEGKASLRKMGATADEYEPLARQFFSLVMAGKHQEVGPMTDKFVPMVNSFDETGQELIEQQRRFLAVSVQEAESAKVTGTVLFAVLLAALASVGVFAGLS